MLKHNILLTSLSDLRSSMNEVAVDIKSLYPDTGAAEQLNCAAIVIEAWIENIKMDIDKK